MKVRITLVVDVDPQARRDEYGEPRMSDAEVRQDVKDSILGTVVQATYPEGSGIIRSVRDASRKDDGR